MLQSVDLAVAYAAALTDARRGSWSSAAIRHQLGLPRATLSKSLGRLRHAGLVRDSFLNRPQMAVLLPVLRNLVPLSVGSGELVRGLVTGVGAPGFGRQIRVRRVQVWPVDGGPDQGVPVKPLYL